MIDHELVSRLEAGNLQCEISPVSIHELVDNLGGLLGPVAEDKSVQLISFTDYRLPLSVLTDQRCLQQLLLSLAGNAIKFTEPGGTVSIEVVLEKIDNGMAKLNFIVEDTGVGMSPVFLQRLLQSFADNDKPTAYHYDDAGLGLPICSRLVELINGSINVNSESGVGSRFTLSVELTMENARPESIHNLSGIKVLNAAGDICNLRELIGNSVRRAGGKIDFVAGTNTAMHEINKAIDEGRAYDVLMICLMWSDETRSKLYENIRALPDEVRPKVLVLLSTSSGKSDKSDKSEYKDACIMTGNPLNMNKIVTNLAIATGRV